MLLSSVALRRTPPPRAMCRRAPVAAATASAPTARTPPLGREPSCGVVAIPARHLSAFPWRKSPAGGSSTSGDGVPKSGSGSGSGSDGIGPGSGVVVGGDPDAGVPRGMSSHLASEVQIESNDRAPGVFRYRVLGHETQVVEIDLHPRESIRAEVGSLLYMTPEIEMETRMGGGFGASLKRVVTAGSFFISEFSNPSDNIATVAFTSSSPSKVLPLRLDHLGGALVCQKGAFLCGAPDTEIEMYFTKKLTTGFFGGEGFVLQELRGNGLVLLRGGGATIIKDLRPGENLRVSAGSLIAFEPSISYEAQMMKGAKNIIFGGEGLFLTSLTGPGRVWLQGLSFDRLLGTIASATGGGGGGGLGSGLMGAAVLGSAMGGGGGGAAGGAVGGAAAGMAGGMAGGAADAASVGDASAADSSAADSAGDGDTGGGGSGWFGNSSNNDDDDDGGDDDGGGGGGSIWSSIFGSDD